MNNLDTEALRRRYADVFGKAVTVTVDRPLGSVHPKHKNIVYGVNYGYVANIIGGDGEEQDAYILGVEKPLKTFNGVVKAVIHRFDDNECKWVVMSEDVTFADDEIIKSVEFQEKFFKSIIIRR